MWLSISKLSRSEYVLKKCFNGKKPSPIVFQKTVLCPKVFQQINLAGLIATTPFGSKFWKNKIQFKWHNFRFFFEYQNGNFSSKFYQPLVFLVFLVKKIYVILTRIAHTIVPPLKSKIKEISVTKNVPPIHKQNKKILHNLTINFFYSTKIWQHTEKKK